MFTLSIIIPVFNEAATIQLILDKVVTVHLHHDIKKEIIIVDDASTDKTPQKVTEYIKQSIGLNIQLVCQEQNTGKGGAIHTGIAKATGDYILIQDADLEYDPNEYNQLLHPVIEGMADVVYGSRFVGGKPHRILFFWHSIGNKMLTFFSNMLTNLNLTDMENGYKLFRADIIKSIPLKEKRFGFEPEVTAKIARIPGIRLYEVGVSYYGRTYEEGKKINWKDGIRAVFAILKYNLGGNQRKEKPELKSRLLPFLVIGLFFLIGLILIFTAKGTADEGDSVMHFLYARYAYQFPRNFFDHWAKPVYVFLAAPFAQMGFKGIKFFNLICSTLTLYLTWRTAQKLAVRNAWLAPLVIICSPLMIIITLSGLTEPLFALWLITGLYWLINRNYARGFLWLSFLPFVRSEGLIILCVIILFILFRKLFKYLPLLLAGHLFYAIAGYFVHHDFLWIFNKMSYATLNSAYGKGNWTDFIYNMRFVTGLVIYFFLVTGLIAGAIRTIKNKISKEELFLVYGCFVAYFIGHSAFWALGIFNSFGLIRVMIGILPLIGIIAANGINTLSFPIERLFHRRIVLYLAILAMIVFPFTHSEFAWKWERDFSLKADQFAEDRAAQFIKHNYPEYKNYPTYFEACYISAALDIDYFDEQKHKRFLGSFEENQFSHYSLLLWDDWYAPVEGHVTQEQLDNDQRFLFIKEFSKKDYWNTPRRVRIYLVK